MCRTGDEGGVVTGRDGSVEGTANGTGGGTTGRGGGGVTIRTGGGVQVVEGGACIGAAKGSLPAFAAAISVAIVRISGTAGEPWIS